MKTRKYDPYQQRVKARVPQTKSFEAEDGGEITLTLRKLTIPEQLAAGEKANKYIQKHITGDPDNDVLPEVYKDFAMMALTDDGVAETFPLSGELFQNAAALETMQPAFLPSDERHNFEWIVAMLALCGEPCFLEIAKFMRSVQKEGKKSANPPTPQEPSSEPSSEPPTDTPN